MNIEILCPRNDICLNKFKLIIASVLFTIDLDCKLADFGLIGVRKDLQGKGIPAIILNYIVTAAKEIGVERVETNHSLEDNHKILQTWKNFDDVRQHKRYRVFTKDLVEKKPKKTSVAKKKTSSVKKTTKKTSTTKASKTMTRSKKQSKTTKKESVDKK